MEFMKYTVEMSSGATIYIQSLIKIGWFRYLKVYGGKSKHADSIVIS
jgi:hypothetical protein